MTMWGSFNDTFKNALMDSQFFLVHFYVFLGAFNFKDVLIDFLVANRTC